MKKVLSTILASLLLATVVSADITLDEGVVAFEVQKANTAWAADGVKSEGEYYDIDLPTDWVSTACSDAANDESTRNLPVDFAMSWDDSYVYMWLSYEDATGHDFNLTDHPGYWDGEIIQVAADTGDGDTYGVAAADNYLEIGFGKTNEGEKMSFSWADAQGDFNANHAANNGAVNDFDCFWDDDTITYEIRVPFSAITTDAPAEGYTFKYAVCMCIDGGAGAYTMWHLADGIAGGGKSSANFADITLAAAPVVETVAEVVEEAAAPQTFDAAVIAAVAAIVSAAGYAVSKKR